MFKLEKVVDLILIILRSVGFLLRKDSPVELKDLILRLQTNINAIKATSLDPKSADLVNNRLKFMLESVNAIKNNDIRRLDAYDQQPIEQLKKQTKLLVREDITLMNVTYKDLISANELGRWWIVGSAWNLKENSGQEDEAGSGEAAKVVNVSGNKKVNGENVFSEKILKLAKEQHMNTDVRKAVFCIILSAEVRKSIMLFLF